MAQSCARVVAAPVVVLAKHKRKILVVPLVALVFAAGLALAPTTIQDVPVLSTLKAEEASAHDMERALGAPYLKRECEWKWKWVAEVSHYVDSNGNLTQPTFTSYDDSQPVFVWSWKWVEECRWVWVDSVVTVAHLHLTETQCEYALLIGSVLLGMFPSTRAAQLAAAVMGLAVGAYHIETRSCETSERIVVLS
ncbi:MAG: hypothetical protein OXH61_15100 [Acidimicrobiaceae bacterium]|nr:hypothetical protein [Acidimicrobiaceae bacterium]